MKPLPWSSSSLECFKNCPHQHYHRYVVKSVKDVVTDQKDWGLTVHTTFEGYLDGAMARLPPSLMEHQDYVEKVKRWDGMLYTEMDAILDRKLVPMTEWRDDRWWGGKIDVLKVKAGRLIGKGEKGAALIVDWKTGKPHEKWAQLGMYAIYAWRLFPDVDIVDARFYWLQKKDHTRKVWQRSEEDQIWALMIPDLKQLATAYKTDTWQKRPSGLCRGYCPVQTCEHWQPKRTWRR